MPYRLHYVFFATPSDGEEELRAFHQALGAFNEQEAMPNGCLFASLEIAPALADKRPFQGSINENIRMSRYYVQVIEDSWGPPQRDFERDWAIAQRSLADPSLPMRETVLLFKAPLLPHKVELAVVELKNRLLGGDGPHASFDQPQQFENILRTLLSRWLASTLAESPMEQCLS
jgi:hypothetical protein